MAVKTESDAIRTIKKHLRSCDALDGVSDLQLEYIVQEARRLSPLPVAAADRLDALATSGEAVVSCEQPYCSALARFCGRHAPSTQTATPSDTERLNWLEHAANGVPIEVDAYTGMTDSEEDIVFLTQVGGLSAKRLAQGRTLREAIDNARMEAP